MPKKHLVYETAKRHGESKTFHYANILKLVSVLLSIPASLYLIIMKSSKYNVINVFVIVFLVALALLQFHSLRNISNFFKGETQQLYGFKRYFQLEIAFYFLLFLSILANFCIVFENEDLDLSFKYSLVISLVITVLTLPMLLPLKKALDHGTAAANDKLASKITIPMKVLAILYCMPNISSLSNVKYDNWITIILIALTVLSMIAKSASQILFAIVLFEYDGDIQKLLSSKKKGKKK